MALEYTWDFGDGETSNLVIPTHTYDYPGKYTVTLRILDTDDDVQSVQTKLSYIVVTSDEVIQRKTNICLNYFVSEIVNNDG